MLSPENLPYLRPQVGDDIITASGTTLLGADDKAGVAIVMTAARHLLPTPTSPTARSGIAFTPDEEIGRGVHPDLPGDLNADVAYTLDGAELGEIVYETFSADKAAVNIQGVSIHPGQAKDKLVNALHLAAKIVDTLPHVTLTPETTDGRQGFIHLYQMSGTAAAAELHFILRDFERDGLPPTASCFQQVCATVQATEPRARITCTITPQYRNMRYWLENDMRPVELAREACRQIGIEPFSTPIRGGTDGSRLTELGVPTPNLFTGMQNIHGPLEWVSVQDMAAATEVCDPAGRALGGGAEGLKPPQPAWRSPPPAERAPQQPRPRPRLRRLEPARPQRRRRIRRRPPQHPLRLPAREQRRRRRRRHPARDAAAPAPAPPARPAPAPPRATSGGSGSRPRARSSGSARSSAAVPAPRAKSRTTGSAAPSAPRCRAASSIRCPAVWSM